MYALAALALGVACTASTIWAMEQLYWGQSYAVRGEDFDAFFNHQPSASIRASCKQRYMSMNAPL